MGAKFDWTKPALTVSGKAVRDLRRVDDNMFGDSLVGEITSDKGSSEERSWRLDGTHVHDDMGLALVNVAAEEHAPFDPSKPFRTRDGRRVEGFRVKPGGCWAGDIRPRVVSQDDGRMWCADGTHLYGDTNLDLVNVAEAEPPRILTRNGREVTNLRPNLDDAVQNGWVWTGEVDGARWYWQADGRWSLFDRQPLDIVSGLPDAPKDSRILTRDGSEVTNLRPLPLNTPLRGYAWAGELGGVTATWTADGSYLSDEDAACFGRGGPHALDIVSGLPREGKAFVALAESDPHAQTYKAEFQTAILVAINRR